MKKKIFKQIFGEYEKQLENLFEPNKRLLICFAGIPGSGKTHLAKKIEKRYKGIRINNDDLRKIISNKVGLDKKEEILKEFILDLLKTFSFENKLVILDSGIERKYEDILNVSKIGGWDMFIIKMVVPKKLIIRRIKIKDRERFEKHPEDIKRWFKEYKDFNDKKIKSDFVFKNNSNLKKLFLKLDRLLKK